MNLNSPSEDLAASTLASIAGTLRKLEYLSGLRSQTGRYVHWGLARVYGEAAANGALQRAHRAVLSQVLSTPLRNLLIDAEQSSKLAGLEPEAYLQRLKARGPCLLPPEPDVGSGRHLNSVLRALSELSIRQAEGAILPVS